MKPGSRRALVGISSIAAVLVPALGIAYLGAVSYRDERGIVAAKLDEQFRVAQTIAGEVRDRVTTTVDEVAVRLDGDVDAEGLRALRARPLAATPFRIAGDGSLSYPAAAPLQAAGRVRDGDFVAFAPRVCPERGFDACIRAVRAARRRAQRLEDARRAELEDPPAARRLYASLARYEDSGPDALLGLARLARRAGDLGRAGALYGELGERFGRRRDRDGVPYALIADYGAAEVAGEAEQLMALYARVLGRHYHAPIASLWLLAERLREQLGALSLEPRDAARLTALDRRLAQARDEARAAQALAEDVDDLWLTAAPEIRGRPAQRNPGRTLVYRRLVDGSVVGVVLTRADLERTAAELDVDLGALGVGVHAVIERVGEPRDESARTRTLASVGFGQVLPHLALALVNDRSLPDPLDEVVQTRGRRHLAITGGLVLLLLIGLASTIRGAARERELARLKSDFVSTVSHELKTPLTSIRMFGEMLQQGVAAGDDTRERRYQDIIVKESQRLGLLIANLLDYSQIERGTRRYSRRRERIGEIAADAVETFQRFGRESGHRVELEIAGDGEVMVDREVVVQSLLNLLANAAKYGGDEHPIVVRVDTRGLDAVAVSVRDRGPGIPAAEHARIFREFYRAPAAYSSGVEGTGLGLALVKRHVEAQGGGVELDSVVGRGSTFTIVFPRMA